MRILDLRKTFLFMDTVVNKVDAKGRVSLPADYRSIVKTKESEIVCYRSLTAPCIEGCLEDLLDKLASEMEDALDFFSETQDDLTNLVFGDAKRYSFDSTGRIMLSDKLLKHAQISDAAVFVGKGRKFQIWNPENWAKEEARIRAEVMKKRPSIRTVSEGDK
ncbi:MAG: division/cell wall cluster transcriptional repressor MraZ [Alphaproteobacteria bacterium]|nr:division/cell wall cluster transcriptional repressor MraZ [Alphaproteobacteria bacterium]